MSKMDPLPSRKVLEIGCGRGEIARRLAARTGMHVLGVDRSERFVQQARIDAVEDTVRFEVMDVLHAEDRFKDDRFDYVVGNGILHHLYGEFDAALRAMRSLLKEKGKILFLEPNLHNPYVYLIFTRPKLRRLARLEPDEMAFTRCFAMQHLNGTGFCEVEVEYRDFLVPGVPDWLIRPLVLGGCIAERTPGVKHLAQSLFISATCDPA
jgi:SAM-dependent methyltransferase